MFQSPNSSPIQSPQPPVCKLSRPISFSQTAPAPVLITANTLVEPPLRLPAGSSPFLRLLRHCSPTNKKNNKNKNTATPRFPLQSLRLQPLAAAPSFKSPRLQALSPNFHLPSRFFFFL
ncbi:hypothetical protein M758_UG229500 [Ceratodon purpureus]|nr:hypothetical protein M758_UG229500 [Ceratodon purpureus]